MFQFKKLSSALILTSLSLMCSSSYAEEIASASQSGKVPVGESLSERKASVLDEINYVARYNGAIIGYAMRCSIDREDVKLVSDYFLGNLAKVNLSPEDVKSVSDNYLKQIQKTKLDGVKSGQVSCDAYKKEFGQIVSRVKQDKKAQEK